MKPLLSLLILFFTCSGIKAQYSLKLTIKNREEKQSLMGATVKIGSIKKMVIADSLGKATFINIASGIYKVSISYIGFEEKEINIKVPQLNNESESIYLTYKKENENEVLITVTRTNRSIKNTPTRIEVIEADEIHEEATMRPGDIRMLLAESTGIQTQQTSATSGNASIRIQGLDGRYTQILKDGFPLYSGAANGLGLLQTPPLDLRQVEIIKGSSSTLFGGGAIAGLINLITKVPNDKKELNFNINGTSAGGLDINNFYSQKFKRVGITLFASRNTNDAYDPANIFFTAIPKFERYTFNPKLFLYFTKKTTLNFGINNTFENRLGGDINFIEGKGDSLHSYFERNKTKRISTQLSFNHQLSDESNIQIKNSISYFNRNITSNNYAFTGTQYSTFTEATYLNKMKESDWVVGVNVLTDQFKEDRLSFSSLRNYSQTTLGVFVQNTWNVADWFTLETGLRGDYIKEYGFALLPRLSALFKIEKGLTSRIGAGFGYKTPTIFTEESERLLYKNILPINPLENSLERSYGANWDINYKTSFDEITFSINQLFFYTYLNHPLTLDNLSSGSYKFQNIEGSIVSKGAETNIKIAYDELALYLGYTYTDAKVYNKNIVAQNPLTPKHRFNAALVYEIEGKWRFGSELYYFSKQQLNDNNSVRDYWLTGLVAERQWKHFSLYINFENIGDIRQTKFENIYTGTLTNPVFKEIYAPLEGFVMNGGIKLKL